MFLFLCLLFGQRPLAVEAAGAGQNGITPHLRVTLETQSHPPVIEYEVWIEGAGGRPPGDRPVELRLSSADGFEVTPLSSNASRPRWRIVQKTGGPLDIPVPTIRWQGSDSKWREHSWVDPLALRASFTGMEEQPEGEIRQPQITPTTILVASVIIISAVFCTAWLSFRKPADLGRLLERPDATPSWWTSLRRSWHLFLAEKIEIHPGTTPTEMAARWEEAGLHEPQTLLRLMKAMEEFRFQPRPPDAGTYRRWIDDARAWVSLVNAETGNKPKGPQV